MSSPTLPPFEEIYRAHYRRVYSICLRMLKNEHEAEDLTQDVFIQIHRKLHLFRGDSALTTWIHRVAVNQVLMYMRKMKRERERVFTVEELDEDAPMFEHISERYLSPDVKIALNDALDKMPEGYKNVLLLHDVDGFEHEQVARILGCSVGTSKSQLFKARQKMKKLLKRKANPKIQIPLDAFS